MRATLILVAALLAGNAAQPVRPNVVFIMTDDMGYGDIGPYGVVDAKTPHLDRLAREGVKLTDGYANGATCTPTRVGFMTGRYQQRLGFERPLDSLHDHDRGLLPTGVSLPALLKKAGYATGLIGKWHLGFQPEFTPNAHGFDEFFGPLAGAVDFYSHRRGDGTHDLYENATPVQSTAYLTDEFSDRSVRFIERNARRPFFLEVAYTAPHWPFQPPDRRPADPLAVPNPAQESDLRLQQLPGDAVPATRADYVRMVERADEGVGKILDALDRLGLAENTLVIFTNDNGGEWLSRNDPFSNRKSSVWEGGIRVPMILRWPGRIPAAATSNQVAITMDLTATILAATGSPVPPAHHPDGMDLTRVLSGAAPDVPRELFWRVPGGGEPKKAVRSGRWKLIREPSRAMLFDLGADPGERQDLSAKHPDIVRRLQSALDAWEKDVAGRPL
ncbi:MAG: sulfatase-like hydrolase/transferase [Acidobacteriota bacterium]|nr:sulfatase-like hydrolase/transferase [Acidobacteriota bacterium]